jgi:hypothetical protein
LDARRSYVDGVDSSSGQRAQAETGHGEGSIELVDSSESCPRFSTSGALTGSAVSLSPSRCGFGPISFPVSGRQTRLNRKEGL